MIAIVLVLSGCSSNDGKTVQGKAGTSITSIKSLDQIANSNQKTDKEAFGSVVEVEKKRAEESVSDENNNGPFGVFASQDAAFADARVRGYEAGQYSNSYTFGNMGNQVWTYFPHE